MAPVRHERDGARVDDVEESSGAGEVGVGDHHLVEAERGDPLHAVVDGAVQPQPGPPDHLGAAPGRPGRDAVVVARDEGRHLGDDVDDPGRHPPREFGTVVVRQHSSEAALRRAESLDRDQHGETHEYPL